MAACAWGSSYYGLDVLSPTSPKLLFRIGADQTDYSRMGQSWSKPVLANIRYNGSIRRVLIVGGGYDQCYEKPNITLTDACFTNGKAKGNAVYIIDAKLVSVCGGQVIQVLILITPI